MSCIIATIGCLRWSVCFDDLFITEVIMKCVQRWSHIEGCGIGKCIVTNNSYVKMKHACCK